MGKKNSKIQICRRCQPACLPSSWRLFPIGSDVKQEESNSGVVNRPHVWHFFLEREPGGGAGTERNKSWTSALLGAGRRFRSDEPLRIQFLDPPDLDRQILHQHSVLYNAGSLSATSVVSIFIGHFDSGHHHVARPVALFIEAHPHRGRRSTDDPSSPSLRSHEGVTPWRSWTSSRVFIQPLRRLHFPPFNERQSLHTALHWSPTSRRLFRDKSTKLRKTHYLLALVLLLLLFFVFCCFFALSTSTSTIASNPLQALLLLVVATIDWTA